MEFKTIMAIILIAVFSMIAFTVGLHMGSGTPSNNTYTLIDLPEKAKVLLNGSECYHSACFQDKSNNTACYVELGKQANTTDGPTCYIGDGNLLGIDCNNDTCIESVRTKFDLDVTQKVNILYHNRDLEQCCIVSSINSQRKAGSYMCWNSTLINCVSKIVKVQVNNTNATG